MLARCSQQPAAVGDVQVSFVVAAEDPPQPSSYIQSYMDAAVE
ncbi:hypothetical protein Afer_1592 [Acidimicrobium ferrooxidans DSM 10331]|uniref:Uncharacterized protein n=1 Tax=Acidimicrobium ferrooxidans (strain DSM 10331 / JCM 15462 / NBRC 103882 / ICP) TaxID=525909 RepID=C7M0K6_ACIFD|nr:hypothetical protein Afer_1592 [Acidimicrobium ferrooxidans DSM 10331]